MNRKTFWLIFSVAAVLRIWNIWDAPLWYDENFTLILARLPMDRLIAATAGDVHPPLWYLIEWALFHALPDLSAWCIRLPALVFSLLAFWQLWRLMDWLSLDKRVQIGALALMAVMPMQLWYAQEGRMYALLEWLVLAALLASLRRNWIGLLLASAAMLYTQNYAVFYLPVIYTLGMLFTFSLYRLPMWPYPLIGLAACLLYFPWLRVIASQMVAIDGRYWIMNVSAGAVLEALYRQFMSSAIWHQLAIPAYAAVFAALILGTITRLRRWPISSIVILPMAFGPLLMAWIASLIWQPVLLYRPLIGISPFLYVIAASLIPPLLEAARPLRLATAALVILPITLGGISGYYANIDLMKGEGAVSSMMDALAYVRAHWQPGDVLYYADDGPMVNLMPYTADLPQFKMPACAERTGYAPVLGSLSDKTRLALGAQIAELSDVPHARAWVFAPRSPLHPQCYEDQIARFTIAPPQITVDDNEYLTSAVWLLEYAP